MRKGPPERMSFRASNRSAKWETKEDKETLMGTNRSVEVGAWRGKEVLTRMGAAYWVLKS